MNSTKPRRSMTPTKPIAAVTGEQAEDVVVVTVRSWELQRAAEGRRLGVELNEAERALP